MDKYTEYINKLNWKNPSNVQKNAIDFLINAEDWDCTGCIMNSPKETWENLINIVDKLGDSYKIKMIDDFLYLLKDLNWPGAKNAFNFLVKMQKQQILNNLELCLKKAYSEQDTIWIANIKSLTEECGLKSQDFNNINLQEIFKIAEW